MTSQEYFKSHGISDKSIKDFGITWDKDKIIFPVFDESGNHIYNKYRHLNESDMKFSFDKGSEATLYNTSILKNNEYIFLTEGEPDCIRLNQEGFPAITNTAGASNFKKEWADILKDKKIIAIYDNDKAGTEGAKKVQTLLPQTIIVKLPDDVNDLCDFLQKYTKKDLNLLIKKSIKDNEVSYEKLCEVIDKWLLIPDKNVIKIILATLVSHFFTTDPLWMFFVAPPSGSKTEIITTIAELDFVYMLSDLTPQTLASGMPIKKDHDPSLLSKLKNNVLVMKDFTTVLTMRQEERQAILSQLREVYDGRYSKVFGTGKRVDWEGRLTMIAGVTPVIDTHSAIFQVMGERFIMYRVPQSDKKIVARKALSIYGKEKEMREELGGAMRKYFYSLKIYQVDEIELPDDILNALASLASFIVTARSGIIRDAYSKEITYIPETEAPARFAKQIGTLIKALAVLDGRKIVDWNDYYMTLRVALDVVPASRMSHILALCNREFMVSTGEVARYTKYSKSGSERILQDLYALELVSNDLGGPGVASEWSFSPEARDYMKDMLPNKIEDFGDIFPKDGPYQEIIKQIKLGTKSKPATDEMKEQQQLAEF